MKNIYFEEKVTLSEEDLANATENDVVKTELKAKIEDVIPLGYIFEDFINQFSNANFQVKANYKLRKNKNLSFDKVQYMASSN